MESVVRSNNLIILNDGSPTRITHLRNRHKHDNLLPQSLVEREIVFNTQMNSDHCVIAIVLESPNSQPWNNISRYNSKKANWTDYFNHAG